jgi:outer membrane protein assembly factor BamB
MVVGRLGALRATAGACALVLAGCNLRSTLPGTPGPAGGDAGARPSAFVVSPPVGAAVAYHIDVAHTGNQPESKLRPPLARQWSVDLGGDVSYPLVVGGAAYVTVANDVAGSKLVALALGSGQTLWGPIDLGGTYRWSNAAFDEGRIYAVNYDGVVTAFDAVSGGTEWTTQLSGQTSFTSPPTAAGGLVFVGGAGAGGTLYALAGATGDVLWKADVENGDDSSPVVSSGAVYVSYACVQAYAFSPLDGTLLWHHDGSCEGGGGNTSVFYQGKVWARDVTTGNLALDAQTGHTVAAFDATAIPAFAGSRGFFLVSDGLQALDVDTRSVLWTFKGDGMLASPPIVVNGTVYVGSASGMLYALDPTGAPTWSDMAPEGISAAGENDAPARPLGGLGAGGDSLLVPAGHHLVCYR